MKPKTKKLATLSMLAMAVMADQHYALLYVPSEIYYLKYHSEYPNWEALQLY